MTLQTSSNSARSPNESTSLTLLARVQASDQVAWTRLVELYGPLVFHWCVRSGVAESDAADVGQEVFLRVSKAISSFRRDRPGDSFRAWLRTIAKRIVVDHHRRLARAPITLSYDIAGIVSDGKHASEESAELGVGVDRDRPSGFTESQLYSADQSELNEERQMLFTRAVELLRREFEPATIEAFTGVAIDGKSAREVADQLQITVNAVYIAKSRVLSRLRADLADE